MYSAIIHNDIRKSKTITIITLLFVAAAGMLVSLAAILAIHLSGALATLMSTAETPHYMQMHSGDLDRARLAAFAEQNGNVDEFQALEFLNIDGARIRLGGQSLADSVQDNGLTVQSDKFDYLLDLDGNRIRASAGELYVPVSYMKDYAVKVGDKAVWDGYELKVAGFLRDSQMNSTLSTSKRFLVNEHDFAALRGSGSIEYLIEFRLKDASKLGEFETAYAAAGLEANGPVVTYPLFRMLNGLSDGIMIGIILLISFLVVAIALLCIRFTILARLEDDYREIGVLKAIGVRLSVIKRLYLAKYAAIAGAGSVLGYALSLLFADRLLDNIRLHMGHSDNGPYALLFGLAGIALVFFVIIGYVNRVLNRCRTISPAEAIRLGAPPGQAASGKLMRLSENRLLGTNIFLGVKDVLTRSKLYGSMLAVLILSAFILLVPQNLHHTIASESFTQYMGIGHYDLRIDIQQTDRIAERTGEIVERMRGDQDIARVVVLTTRNFQVRTEHGSMENMAVELGDHAVFPVAYSEGGAPVAENEIALSAINADELGKQVGDSLTLVIEGEARQLAVSGIYADVTNGGRTARASFPDESAALMRSIVSAELTDPALARSKAAEYGQRYPYAKVSDIAAFVEQTFGSTISAVKQAANAAIAVAIIAAALVTLLFMKMLVAKDRYAIAVMKTFGFSNADIQAQYVTRSVIVAAVGILAGTLLANTVGEWLAGAVIASIGASAFRLAADPLSAYLLSPLLMTGTVLAATLIGTSGAGQITIAARLKEQE